ncbi:F0F1 ATP synthase subunit delta [Paenibacillus thermoaerophilus]|jgi:F-type H+-transporting ATPase subunit delta|uniref:ATP synthase subunit delta n=1 Tax=Paenibacillus thermoaerophilus TaxID=1215385 RepID=A0ABW2V7F5_9BACL|nr:F0F1 ATP synthase subunit delta [Paenibacillus thermoaerophilus]TMV12480.1 F0F1 ATP synthase subunit delta [Paenibacillus thermoaerophilus]
MSRDIAVAKRYARALFEIAREKGIVEQVGEDLQGIAATIKADKDFAALLAHPSVSTAAKKEILAKAFEGRVTDVVFNTIQLLADRRREELLPTLAFDYMQIADEASGSARATIRTPRTLSDEEVAKIAEQFGKLAGKTIRAVQELDPSLIGGIQVRIGDRLYDGSVSGKLARLQKALQ